MRKKQRTGVDHRGVPSEDELQKGSGIPSKDRQLRGPVAVIECFQEIPCNVCEVACPSGAIEVGHPMTRLPVLVEDKCSGCGSCIPLCPGLAIFVVDLEDSKDYATVSIPYEFLPLPKPGDEVYAVDREGKILCKAEVLRTIGSRKFDKTHVITIRLPRRFAMDARFIKLMEAES